jgi:uncharacterized membrane protein YbhN (UPF0104 family)
VDVPARVPLAIGGGFALVALAYLLLRKSAHRVEAWLARPREGGRGRLAGAGLATLKGTGALARDRAALAAGLIGGVLFVLASGFSQHAALLAVGSAAPWWLALLAVALGGLLGGTVGAPGGVGVTEAAQIAFLTSQGVADGEATAAVLIARGLHYLVILAGGLSAVAWEAAAGRWSRSVISGADPADALSEEPTPR